MILNNVDYHRLSAKADLCKMLKREVGAAVVAEAGNVISAQHVKVELKPGSVAISAAISSLSGTVASDVGKRIKQSATLGWRVADKVTGVRGIAAVTTGPVTVTDISTTPILKKDPAANNSWLIPVRITLWSILALCVLGALPTWYFFSKQRSHEGYVIAANDEPKALSPCDKLLSPREGSLSPRSPREKGQSPREEKPKKGDVKDAKDEQDGKNGKDEKDAKSAKGAKGAKTATEKKDEDSTKDANDKTGKADGKSSKEASGDKDAEVKRDSGTTQGASTDAENSAAKAAAPKPRTRRGSAQPKARGFEASLDDSAKPQSARKSKQDPAAAGSESTSTKAKKSDSEEGAGADAPSKSQDALQRENSNRSGGKSASGDASTEASPKKLSGASSPKTGAKRKPKAQPKR